MPRIRRVSGVLVAVVCLFAVGNASASASPPISGTREHPCKVVYGVLEANVASVKVIFHHRGQHRRVERTPTTALVSGELLIELHQTEPFGAYALTISGCVPPKRVRAIAFDSQGLQVGSARPPSFLAHLCNPKTWFRRR